jgi:hypothetical protein
VGGAIRSDTEPLIDGDTTPGAEAAPEE